MDESLIFEHGKPVGTRLGKPEVILVVESAVLGIAAKHRPPPCAAGGGARQSPSYTHWPSRGCMKGKMQLECTGNIVSTPPPVHLRSLDSYHIATSRCRHSRPAGSE